MVLKHRDTEVLRFDWLEPEGVRVTSVNEAALRFLPLEMHGEPTDEQLWRWLRHRIVPKHRNYIQEMLIEIGVTYGVRSNASVDRIKSYLGDITAQRKTGVATELSMIE